MSVNSHRFFRNDAFVFFHVLVLAVSAWRFGVNLRLRRRGRRIGGVALSVARRRELFKRNWSRMPALGVVSALQMARADGHNRRINQRRPDLHGGGNFRAALSCACACSTVPKLPARPQTDAVSASVHP